MESKELRISDQKGFKGSYILHKGDVKNVFALYQLSQVVIWLNDEVGMKPVDVSELNPVPLTEEWLVKFGLEVVDLIKENKYLKDCVGFWPDNENFVYVIDLYGNEMGDWGYVTKEIKYVHQLQNLYFALTGKELELNEKQP